MKLAFVGPPAVGKDTVADYVEKKYKLTHISSGNLVREHIKKNNLGSLERKNLQIVANKLRAEGGGDVLVKMAFDIAKDNMILSGLRAIDEVETFKKMGGKVISITAPIEKRYELGKMRGRIGDDISFEDFKRVEQEEQSSPDRINQNVDKVMSMADIEITNDSSLENLLKKSDELIEAMRKS